MNAPMDQQIMDALYLLMQGIRTANGYATDLGERVWLEAGTADADQMVLELIDATETATYQSAGKRQARLQVTATATVPHDSVSPRKTARLALADMRRALAGVSLDRFPLGTQSLQVGGRRINPPDDGSGFIEAELDLAIQFVEKHKEHNP